MTGAIWMGWQLAVLAGAVLIGAAMFGLGWAMRGERDLYQRSRGSGPRHGQEWPPW